MEGVVGEPMTPWVRTGCRLNCYSLAVRSEVLACKQLSSGRFSEKWFMVKGLG